MKRCCNDECRQGRDCPLRTVRIPTHRHIVRRLAADLWQALEDHWWLPFAIAAALVLIVNTTGGPP